MEKHEMDLFTRRTIQNLRELSEDLLEQDIKQLTRDFQHDVAVALHKRGVHVPDETGHCLLCACEM
jgi:hypothetical protein